VFRISALSLDLKIQATPRRPRTKCRISEITATISKM
jgi:hypothetical protein